MRTVLAAVLALAHVAPASATSELSALRELEAAAGPVKLAVPVAPRAVTLAERSVAGEASGYGAVRGEGTLQGFGEGYYRTSSFRVSGTIVVNGPGGAWGPITVTGVAEPVPFLRHASASTHVRVEGRGTLYRGGQPAGEVLVSGSGPLRVNVSGFAAEAAGMLRVSGRFTPKP